MQGTGHNSHVERAEEAKGKKGGPPKTRNLRPAHRALLGTWAQSDLDENRDSLALAWLLRSCPATPSP